MGTLTLAIGILGCADGLFPSLTGDVDTEDTVDLTGICPAYFEWGRPGLYREGESDEGWVASGGDWVHWFGEVVEFEADGSKIVVEGVSERESDDGELLATAFVHTWGCDFEGAWLVESRQRRISDETEDQDIPTAIYDYETDGAWIPWGLDVGTMWSLSYRYRTATEYADTEELAWSEWTDYATSYEVVAAQTARVPAGSFEVLEVRQYHDVGDLSNFTALYRDAVVGTVAEETWELTDYELP